MLTMMMMMIVLPFFSAIPYNTGRQQHRFAQTILCFIYFNDVLCFCDFWVNERVWLFANGLLLRKKSIISFSGDGRNFSSQVWRTNNFQVFQ
jgi:hypothetical protein